MLTIPADRLPGRSREGLEAFLGEVRALADRDGAWRVASITLEVGHLDPLAVLAAIENPAEHHACFERPDGNLALAGADAVALGRFEGPGRWREARDWAQALAERLVVTGDLDSPLAGPRLLAAFTFEDASVDGAPFAAGNVFLPRWMVARHGGWSTAVANVRVDPGVDVRPLAARVLAAHAKFSAFDYAPGPSRPSPGSPELVMDPDHGADAFRASVGEALGAIAAGRYRKIVLSRAVPVAADRPLSAAAVLGRLRDRFPSCWSCSFASGRGPTFLAATPERLVALSGGEVLTEALAGSAPRGSDPAQDAALAAALLASDKDRREHALVLESIARRLGGLGIEAQPASRPELLRLPNVQHLRTPVRARAPRGTHVLDLAAVLHPTPAVGGQPREAALPDIRRLEGRSRGLYAGALGWFHPGGDGEFVVGLRSAVIDGSRAEVYAGAGIVAGSDPDRELRETALKLSAVLGGLR